MKRAIQLVLLILCALNVSAQQEPMFSQYMMNPFSLNPAYSSTEDYIDVQAGYRSQWTQFSGSPNTAFISGHGTINKPFYKHHYKAEHKNWHGVGFQVLDDRIGPQVRNSVLLAYSYNIGLFSKSRISFGSFFGVKRLSMNHSYWQNIADETDELFLTDLNTGVKPELQLGVHLYEEENYYVSASFQNLLGNSLDYNEVQANMTEGNYEVHSYISAGKRFWLKSELYVMPSTMIRVIPNSPVAFDLNAKLEYQYRYWGGISLRSTKAVNLFAGLNINHLVDITFAYEYDFNVLSSYNTGTCELIVGLRLGHPQTVLNPSQFW